MLSVPNDLIGLADEKKAIWTTLHEGLDESDHEARAALEGMYEDIGIREEAELGQHLTDLALMHVGMEASILANKAFIAPIEARIAMQERSLATIREHAEEAMALFGKTSWQTPPGTWTRSQRPTPEIFSAADLPSPEERPELYRFAAPEPNKTAINKIVRTLAKTGKTAMSGTHMVVREVFSFRRPNAKA